MVNDAQVVMCGVPCVSWSGDVVSRNGVGGWVVVTRLKNGGGGGGGSGGGWCWWCGQTAQ